MARLNQDLNQRRRWERRQADLPEDVDALRERIGSVMVIKDAHPEWAFNSIITVRDLRTKTLLTFVSWVSAWGSEFGGGWEVWSGLPPDRGLPDAALCTWNRGEFADTFSSERYVQSLNSMLKLIRCPNCPSWTGGGMCFHCAAAATRDLCEKMTDV